MNKLIGQITYPKVEAFAVEYAKLYSENDGTTLEFRLVNNGTKAVNAYRVDISYSVNGEEKTQSFQGRNLELIKGSTTDTITCSLAGDVEEGSIILSAVIYDDLTHNPSEESFPFASFDTISRKAESMLSGAVPTKMTVQAPKTNIIPTNNTVNIATQAVQDEEPAAKASSLPLILSLAALGGLVLSLVVRYLFQF